MDSSCLLDTRASETCSWGPRSKLGRPLPRNILRNRMRSRMRGRMRGRTRSRTRSRKYKHHQVPKELREPCLCRTQQTTLRKAVWRKCADQRNNQHIGKHDTIRNDWRHNQDDCDRCQWKRYNCRNTNQWVRVLGIGYEQNHRYAGCSLLDSIWLRSAS